MSSGMNDGAAVDEMHRDLRRAAAALRDAIRWAREGHRGIGLSADTIMETVNPYLEDMTYELRVRPRR